MIESIIIFTLGMVCGFRVRKRTAKAREQIKTEFGNLVDVAVNATRKKD